MNGLYRFHVSPDVTSETVPAGDRPGMSRDNREHFADIVAEVARSILRGSGYTLSAPAEGCYFPESGPVSYERSYVLEVYGINASVASVFAKALAGRLHQDSVMVAAVAYCDVSFVGAA